MAFNDLLQIILVTALLPAPNPVIGQPASHWRELGQDALQDALNLRMNQNQAKNVILFLGDGMDIITTTASRILKGQRKGNTGEEDSLTWEQFPHVALSKTYNTDFQVPDSAGTATAFMSGVKTRYSIIGFDDGVHLSNCSSEASAEKVASILEDAITYGKATGVVTTTRITHATPAAAYAHSAHRNWESDSDLTEEAKLNGCVDIASQLIQKGTGIQVILGGGRRSLLHKAQPDPEYPDKNGSRTDGRDLTEEWLQLWRDADMTAEYVWNSSDFNAVDYEKTDGLLGLFEPGHMQYEQNRNQDRGGEPSLSEMTEKAIEILKKDEDGFFLLVEAGRIDHGHHDGVAHRALTDTLALDAAVGKALELVDTDDTLIVVTADHAHVMSIAGYPSRGNPILGLSDTYKGSDGLPYTTLSYMNGYGFRSVNESFYATNKRPNLTNVDTEDPNFMQNALVPMYEQEETHGGQDVAIYATGPMAHLLHGVQEQSYIAHVIKYASCLGENTDHCDNPPNAAASLKQAATNLSCFTFAVIIVILAYL